MKTITKEQVGNNDLNLTEENNYNIILWENKVQIRWGHVILN